MQRPVADSDPQVDTDAHAPAGASDGLPIPRRYWSMAAIWLAMSMSVLDGAIANVALPTIAGELHATPAASIWVVNAYQLAITVALLPLASLGEIWGYAKVYRVGLALYHDNGSDHLYWVRLIAFGIILYAIWDKNRSRGAAPPAAP